MHGVVSPIGTASPKGLHERERLLESPRLRHRPPRDPFTTSGGYCTWRVGQIK